MAKSVNVVIVEGGVVRQPEMKYTAHGAAYTRFAIAHKGFSKSEANQEDTSYFEIMAWGKVAEICSSYLKKGRRVIVSGRLRQNRWKDEAGQIKTKVVIMLQDIKFMPSQKARKDSYQNEF